MERLSGDYGEILMHKNVSKTLCFTLVLTVLVLSLLPITASANTYPQDGYLKWKGLTWYVWSGQSLPGNNYWNEKGVWVDDQNRLHLSIIKKNGKWYCTGLETVNFYKYGTFTWTVASPVYKFDKNSILGLYTYLDDYNELDIEATRWGYESGDNIDYSVQPTFKYPNNERTFKVKGTTGANTTYKLEWKPKYVRFSSMQNGKIVNKWTFKDASHIPKTKQNVCMNLWLNYKPPSDGKNIECIISDFNITS